MKNARQLIKDIFSPFELAFPKLKTIPPSKKDCCSMNLIDKESQAKYKKTSNFVFTKTTLCKKMDGRS